MPTLGTYRYLDLPATAPERGTLVLVHAFPLNARMWEPQAALAAAGWRVVAPQLRGFDAGTGDPPVGSVDDYAADVAGLMAGLGLRDPVVGGLSLGGYVTFALLRRHPGIARALVLADTRAEADTAEGLAGRRRMLQLLEDRGAQAVVDEMLPKLVGAATARERPEVTARVRELAGTAPAGAIAGALRAMMGRPDSTPLLGTLRCPTLVVVGDEDVLTPPALAESLQRQIPGAELATIPEAGHLSNLERPEAFNAAVAAFLERARPRV